MGANIARVAPAVDMITPAQKAWSALSVTPSSAMKYGRKGMTNEKPTMEHICAMNANVNVRFQCCV